MMPCFTFAAFMKNLVYLLLFVLVLSACGNASKTDESTVSAKDTTAAKQRPDWYKRFEGTLAGAEVVLHLQKEGTTIGGNYYYLKSGAIISLNGWGDTIKTDAEWLLTENPTTESRINATGDAQWLVVLKNDSLTGTWTGSNGKQFPILLHEAYNDMSLELNVLYIADSARYSDSLTSPQATSNYQLLLPPSDIADAPRSFLENAFVKAIGCTDKNMSGEACIRQSMDIFFREWRNQMSSIDSAHEDLSMAMNNHSSDFYQHVMYNDNGLLVVENFDAGYSGGAHGNYAASYLNLDWKEQQNWQLTDIFNRNDTASLIPLLDAQARKYTGIKNNQAISEYLFVYHVPITTNFFIGTKGITFVYNPYEIASYADGQIFLYLTFETLKLYLTKEFMMRMGL